MNDFCENGYSLHKNVIDSKLIQDLREEAEVVAQNTRSTCVRHLRHSSKTFAILPSHPSILNLLPSGLRPVRSILFNKTANENWPVMWHQDLTIAVKEEKATDGYGPWSYKNGSSHVQPPTNLLSNMVTMRLHLDNTPSTNGALQVIPKSHLFGKIPPEKISNYTKDNHEIVTCECASGDILLMSPLILHSSKRSTDPSSRRVIHIEFARNTDLDSSLSWFETDTA